MSRTLKLPELGDAVSISPTQKVIRLVLGTSPLDQTELSVVVPPYKAAIYSNVILNLVDKLAEEKAIVNIGYNGYSPANWQILPLSRYKSEKVLVDGYILIKGRRNLVVNMYSVWGGFKIRLIGKTEDEVFLVKLLQLIHDTVSKINPWKGETVTPFGKYLTLEKIALDDVILTSKLKERLKATVFSFFSKKKLFEQARLPFKRGVIFSGVPGTGKTLTGKALANSLSGVTFIWVTADDMKNTSVASIFNMARELQPSVLFVEDIDRCLVGSTLDELKTQMDGLVANEGVLVLLSTNFPRKIPKTLIDRPGRFDDVIEFSLPNPVLRFKILWKYAKNIPIENRKQSIALLAKITKGLTPAHLKEIVTSAILMSNSNIVTVKSLIDAFRRVQAIHQKFGFSRFSETTKSFSSPSFYIKKAAPKTGQWTIEEGMTGKYVIQCHSRGIRPIFEPLYTDRDIKKLGLDPAYFIPSDKELESLENIVSGWKSAISQASKEGQSSRKLSKLVDKVLKQVEFKKLPAAVQKRLALLDPVSIHQDLRLVPLKADYFEGGHWTTPGNQFKDNKLLRLDEHIHVQFMLKAPHVSEYSGKVKEPVIRGPASWLQVGVGKPLRVPPNSIGSTAKNYAFFYAHDKGFWLAGKQASPHGKHFKLFKFSGKVLNGWIIFMFAPLGGRRVWLTYKPKDQEKYNDRQKRKIAFERDIDYLTKYFNDLFSI